MSKPRTEKLRALVTGGSRGIGRAISCRLAEAGAETIIVNYLQNDDEASRTAALIEARGCGAILARANLLYPAEINQLFEIVRSSVDGLYVLIHCAALGSFKPMHRLKPNQWDLTMNINARGFLLCVQQALELMNAGSIVAVSSLGSQRVVPNYGAMGPTKAALEAMVRYLAVELAPAGIRVNGVSGGFVDTDSIRAFPDAENLIESVSARTPAGGIATADELADVAMFLISPPARWIYGQTIVADGGFSLH